MQTCTLENLPKLTSENADKQATVKFPLEATIGAKGAIRRFLERESFMRSDLDIEWSESGGFFCSQFLVKISGQYRQVYCWLTALKDAIDSMNGG